MLTILKVIQEYVLVALIHRSERDKNRYTGLYSRKSFKGTTMQRGLLNTAGSLQVQVDFARPSTNVTPYQIGESDGNQTKSCEIH